MHVKSGGGNGNGGCVLVVEDHEDTLRLLLRLLNGNGYTAHGALSMREALATAGRERCSILVTDLGLPDGSGVELLRTLRADGSPDVKAIAVTGHTGADVIQSTREAGFAAHLVKPVRFDQLLAALAGLNP